MMLKAHRQSHLQKYKPTKSLLCAKHQLTPFTEPYPSIHLKVLHAYPVCTQEGQEVIGRIDSEMVSINVFFGKGHIQ